MAPPERELDTSKPLHAFAAELRALRMRAGNPKYLSMARRSGGVSRTALSEAAGGDHVPTWRTVEGYVRACGADPVKWLPRWERMREEVGATGSSTNGSSTDAGDDTSFEPADARLASRRARWLWSAISFLLVVVTGVTVHMADVLMLPAQASAPPKPANLAVIVVQNKVAMGKSDQIEDSTPAFLSSRPVPFCSRNGCVVPGTLMPSGVRLVADCHVTSTMMYNYNLDSSEVQTNPYRAKSDLWYHVVMPDGAGGFISEVYIEPAYRGGRGLPVCKT